MRVMVQFWHFRLYMNYIYYMNIGKYTIRWVFGIVDFSIARRGKGPPKNSQKSLRSAAYLVFTWDSWCFIRRMGVVLPALVRASGVFFFGMGSRIQFLVCWLVECLTCFNLAGELLLMLEMIIYILQWSNCVPDVFELESRWWSIYFQIKWKKCLWLIHAGYVHFLPYRDVWLKAPKNPKFRKG